MSSIIERLRALQEMQDQEAYDKGVLSRSPLVGKELNSFKSRNDTWLNSNKRWFPDEPTYEESLRTPRNVIDFDRAKKELYGGANYQPNDLMPPYRENAAVRQNQLLQKSLGTGPVRQANKKKKNAVRELGLNSNAARTAFPPSKVVDAAGKVIKGLPAVGAIPMPSDAIAAYEDMKSPLLSPREKMLRFLLRGTTDVASPEEEWLAKGGI